MADGLVTSRPIQNETTGIDLQVPAYQEVHGAMMSGHVEYKIIVVTRLEAFKSPRHKPGDTVQLVVSKQYSDIVELYNRLAAQCRGIDLPAMPRKALFVGEADIRERRAAFDDLMRFIAKTPTLASSSELLDFLGAKSADVKPRNVLLGEEPDEEEFNFFQEEEASVPRKPPVLPQAKLGENTNEGDDEEEEEPYLGPLGNPKSKKKAKPRLLPKPTKVSLFGDQSPDADLFSFPAKQDSLKLFEDPCLGGTVNLGDALLLPTAYNQAGSSWCAGQDEDTEELFRLDGDLDKLLHVTKRTRSIPSPGAKPKPREAPPATRPRAGDAAVGTPPVAADQLKDHVDILKYIQQNELEADEEEDLF